MLLGCLGDTVRAYFDKDLESKIEVLGGLGQVWGGLGWGWVVCCGVLCGLGWPWVVLGEVLGGFWRPARFRPCMTVEAQGWPRGVRGARGAKRPPKVGSRRDLILSSFFQRFFVDFLVIVSMVFGTILSTFLWECCYH